MEEEIVELLDKYGLTFTSAESCTAGLVSAAIVNAAGASNVFNQSFVTYSNEAKHRLLGVKNKTLKQDGAVSKRCAKEMVKGVAKAANAKAAISVTGIAGPDGGTKEKPVGLVYIGCMVNGHVKVKKFLFNGSRQENRMSSVNAALKLLKKMLLKYGA